MSTMTIRRMSAGLAALAVAVSLLVVAGTPVAATTVSVATETEYRDALTALSTDNTGPHVIEVTADFTIVGATDPTYNGTQPLTINGNGKAIDANGNSRFLNHDVSQALMINDLTVRNGSTGGSGGAVAANATVEVNSSIFTGNSADAFGGAIAAGAVTATDCTFSQNRSERPGGAIHTSSGSISADVTLTGCTFTENVSDDGGAISATDAGAVVTVTGSRFENNGDPINAPVTEDGGAIRARTADISGSTFVGNRAENGGAVYTGGGDARIVGSTFTGNSAEEDGGAIDAGTASVTGSTFVDNTTVDGDGGAIDADAGDIVDSLFDGNTAGEDNDGGAVHTSDGAVTIDGSTFVRNTTSGDGQGGAIDAATNVTATNTTFTQNTGGEDVINAAGDEGGGDVTLRYVTFVDNVTVQTDPQDGAIDSDGEGTLTSFGSAFGGNSPNTCEPDFGAVVSEGYNYADDDSCGLDGGPGDVENGPDPQVEPLGDFGGPTPTRPPMLPDSPLIDAIPVADCYPGIAVDQRDLPRPEDGNGDGANGCDIGAVEVQAQDSPRPTPAPDGPVAARPTFTG